MDYHSYFNKRVDSFLYAINKYENCLNEELKTAINNLNIKDNDILVNLGGGGINLDKFIDNKIKITYIPLEFNKEFSEKINIPYCNYYNIPLKDNSVDKIIIMALLHHFNDKERNKLYKECYRILKKDGIFIICDVIKNSNQDIWLNTIVNKYNPLGHKGIFFNEKDDILIKNNNFNVDIKIEKYNWIFNNKDEMIDFMKNLFYLNIELDKLYELVKEILNYDDINNKFDWKLIYFISTKNTF